MKKRTPPIKDLADIASAFKGALAKPKAESGASLTKPVKEVPVLVKPDLGLSTYERCDRAIKDLIQAKNQPRRIMDSRLIIRLENLIAQYQKLIREEVQKFGPKFPRLTHAEISKKALEHKALEQEEILRQESLRLAQEEEKKRQDQEEEQRLAEENVRQQKAEKLREEREKRLLKNAIARAAEQDKLLTEKAKELKKELGLMVCKCCENGKEKVECDVCSGTGKVAPYNVVLTRMMSDCCGRPNCPICAGTGTYMLKATVSETKCVNPTCRGGMALAACSVCYGSQIVTKQGKRLTLALLRNIPLIKKIQKLLVLKAAWAGID